MSSKWKEIRSTYRGEGTVRPVDAYLTDNDMEEGCVIANFDIKDKTVTYLDDDARTDLYAQEVISSILKEYGIDLKIIAIRGRYAVIQRGDTEYVVACGFHGLGTEWEQGVYFTYNGNTGEKATCLAGAMDTFRTYTEDDFIPRERLIALLQLFADGLIRDNKAEAMEYFDSICDMSDGELLLCGITEE